MFGKKKISKNKETDNVKNNVKKKAGKTTGKGTKKQVSKTADKTTNKTAKKTVKRQEVKSAGKKEHVMTEEEREARLEQARDNVDQLEDLEIAESIELLLKSMWNQE